MTRKTLLLLVALLVLGLGGSANAQPPWQHDCGDSLGMVVKLLRDQVFYTYGGGHDNPYWANVPDCSLTVMMNTLGHGKPWRSMKLRLEYDKDNVVLSNFQLVGYPARYSSSDFSMQVYLNFIGACEVQFCDNTGAGHADLSLYNLAQGDPFMPGEVITITFHAAVAYNDSFDVARNITTGCADSCWPYTSNPLQTFAVYTDKTAPYDTLCDVTTISDAGADWSEASICFIFDSNLSPGSNPGHGCDEYGGGATCPACNTPPQQPVITCIPRQRGDCEELEKATLAPTWSKIKGLYREDD